MAEILELEKIILNSLEELRSKLKKKEKSYKDRVYSHNT